MSEPCRGFLRRSVTPSAGIAAVADRFSIAVPFFTPPYTGSASASVLWRLGGLILLFQHLRASHRHFIDEGKPLLEFQCAGAARRLAAVFANQNKCRKRVTRANTKLSPHGLGLSGIQSHSSGNFFLTLRDIDEFQVSFFDFPTIPRKHRVHLFGNRCLWKRDDNQAVLIPVYIEWISQYRVTEECHYERNKSETPTPRNLVPVIRFSGERFHAVCGFIFPSSSASSADDRGVCCFRAKIPSCDREDIMLEFAVANLVRPCSRGSIRPYFHLA